jgi:hypothetical protein
MSNQKIKMMMIHLLLLCNLRHARNMLVSFYCVKRDAHMHSSFCLLMQDVASVTRTMHVSDQL